MGLDANNLLRPYKAGLLTPFRCSGTLAILGWVPPEIWAPAASIVRLGEVCASKGRGKRMIQTLGCLTIIRRDGAPNDDLRAVLDKLWGVGYTCMYIKCRFADPRPLMPLQGPRRAEFEFSGRKFGAVLARYIFLRALNVPFVFTQGVGSFTSRGFFDVYGWVLSRAGPGSRGPGPAEVSASRFAERGANSTG